MAVINVDPLRFDPSAPPTVNAEKQRLSVSRKCVDDSVGARPDNGDAVTHTDRRGTFTKGLPHDPVTGLVQATAFDAFRTALASERDAAFAAIETLGPHTGAGHVTRKWVSPIAGRAFAPVGGDPQQYTQPPPPAFGSDELSFELIENYWMAILRDVPFSEYSSHPLAARAVAELNGFHRVLGGAPRCAVDASGAITPSLLFRGLGPGENEGPYISQFLLKPVPFGVQGFEQRNRTLRPGTDFLTNWTDWLAVQNGAPRDFEPRHFDPALHYVRNGRDLSQWVHIDVLFQAYFNACLMLLQGPSTPSSVGGGVGAPDGCKNPYRGAARQAGFATLGGPEHISMLCEVAALALRAVWYQKWYVHLRFRPEVYAGRVDRELRAPGAFGLPAALLHSDAVGVVRGRHGSALLPMAFPEGSPMHPAYGAGHATVAGACVTILKALFDVSGTFPDPVDVVVAADGSDTLAPCACPLTLEGELNKLASNVALGRNVAGVHWRSDGTESLKLGEKVALDLLKVYAMSYAEVAAGTPVFTLRRFDGTSVTVSA